MSERSNRSLLGMAALTALASAAGVSLIKMAVRTAEPQFGLLAAGLALYAASVLCGMVLLARHPISVVYPMVVGLSLAILAIISAVFAGEPMGPAKAAGNAVIILGVALLVRSSSRPSERG